MQYTLTIYETESGEAPFRGYMRSLRDPEAKQRIVRRLIRAEMGNLGDHHSIGDGLHEMRLDYGPGYRVYYTWRGKKLILLLCAGDKNSQSADITKAVSYKNDFERRNP